MYRERSGDPVDEFVRAHTQNLRGEFDGQRVRDLMTTIAHQAVKHFGGGNEGADPGKMRQVGSVLDRMGHVQYDDIDPGDRERFYGATPAQVVREFELDFIPQLGDGVPGEVFKDLAGKTMQLVAGQPAIDIHAAIDHCRTQALLPENGTLTLAEYYLREAAIRTAYGYAAAYFNQGNVHHVA